MKLTKSDFSLLSTNGQIRLIEEKGISILSVPLGNDFQLKLVLLYDFYVEVICRYSSKKIERVNLAIIEIPIMFFD